MTTALRSRHWRTGSIAAAVAAAVSVPAMAEPPFNNAKNEHWGVITRNTIGSPVAALRYGPYGSFGVVGSTAEPPFGKGSLGIAVAVFPGGVAFQEKVDFGNEVDFFGDPVLALSEVGFHVFQTGENVSAGGPRNMPNIRLEIDANLNALPGDNYTSMVWVPDAAPAVNQWSGYIDATSSGNWFFTGAEGGATGCTGALSCDFTAAMNALNDGGETPIVYSLAVGKGRDNAWVGAIDGLRLNDTIFDFEADQVKRRSARSGR